MAARSRPFAVFVDESSTDSIKPKPNKKLPLGSSSIGTLSVTTTFAAPDKENVNPLTGERATNATGKKRKENAVTGKPAAPLVVKFTPAAAEETKPDKKKRKSSSLSSSTKEKSGRKGISSKKGSRRSPRRITTLPRLEEDVEAEKEKERAAQADIDSRCYELTVKPLADVSAAYGSFDLLHFSPPKSKFNFVKDSSTEPEIGDFGSSFGANLLPRDSSREPSRMPSPSSQETLLATPERKRIYAFTFSSPSRSSERCRLMTRATSVPVEQITHHEPMHPASSP